MTRQNKARTISATNLGYYASSRFCPRCAWVRLHLGKLPYQSFPGIFSSIDSYNKKIVHNHFDREDAMPSWLDQLGNVAGYIEPPHWSKFRVVDEASKVTLHGTADGIFRMADGSYTIIDYKTARYTASQEIMLLNYEVQLNAYAFIGERKELSPVSKLALVYMEPQTSDETAQRPELVDDSGFSMEFDATVVEVDLKPEELIPPLLQRVRQIGEMEAPPNSGSGCKECDLVEALIREWV